MKLENAYICGDCEEVSESNGHGECVVCGSQAILNLSKVLNRHEEKAMAKVVPLIPLRVIRDLARVAR